MKLIVLLKKSLILFCFSFFLYQVWKSYNKLMSKDVISLSKTVTNDLYDLPDVRFCHQTIAGDTDYLPENMSDVYKSKGPLKDTIVGVQVGDLYGDSFYTGKIPEAQPEDWTEDVLPVYILKADAPIYQQIECYTLTRKGMKLKYGTVYGVQLYVNVSKSGRKKDTYQMLYIGNPGNTVFSERVIYGTALEILDLRSLDLSMDEPLNTLMFNMQASLRQKLPISDEYECTPEGTDSLYDCSIKHVVQSIHCRSPYDKGYDDVRVCSTKEDLLSYQSLYYNSNKTSKLSYFTNELGCKIPCAHNEYKLASLSVSKRGCHFPQGCKDVIALQIVSLSDQQEVITEKWLYDESNFIADVGGYLGLLLGVSVLTIFDYGHNISIALKNYLCSRRKVLKRSS